MVVKKVRLSGMQDIDLIILKENRSFSLEGAIYSALAAYVRGERIEITVPDNPPPEIKSLKKTVYVRLDEEKDSDIIEFYDSLVNGARTMAIKSILRNYLSKPNIEVLMNEEFKAEIDKMKARLREAGVLEKKPRSKAPGSEADAETPEDQMDDEDWDLFSDPSFVEEY